jgi:hypothetical protein
MQNYYYPDHEFELVRRAEERFAQLDAPSHKDADYCFAHLLRAALRPCSEETCLRYWSRFVRARDGFHCVLCGDTSRVSAHHICRKSFMPDAALEPGNGITLCRVCHKEVGGLQRPSGPCTADGLPRW